MSPAGWSLAPDPLALLAAARATIPAMEITAIFLSGLSLVVAIAGTALANKRSSEALNESQGGCKRPVVWGSISGAAIRRVRPQRRATWRTTL